MAVATRALWKLLAMCALLAADTSIAEGSGMSQSASLATAASGDGNDATNAIDTTPTTAPTVPAGSTQLCDAQLLFQKLYVLMPAINQCATESDYFIKPSNLSMPSDASLAKYCGSKNCSLLSQELDNAGLPSCSVAVGNSTMAFKVFFKNVKDHCDSSSASNASSPSPPSTGSGASGLQLVWQPAFAALLISMLVAV